MSPPGFFSENTFKNNHSQSLFEDGLRLPPTIGNKSLSQFIRGAESKHVSIQSHTPRWFATLTGGESDGL